MYYEVFETELGWIAIVSSMNGVVRTSLPELTPTAALDAVKPESDRAIHGYEHNVEIRALIAAYCAGESVDLSGSEIDVAGVSPFFKKAWEACRTIPFGETRSYRWLAEKAGNLSAARAAGQAMARNRLPLLVPCHRVVASDGSLHGFGGDGLPLKSRLLAMETRYS